MLIYPFFFIVSFDPASERGGDEPPTHDSSTTSPLDKTRMSEVPTREQSETNTILPLGNDVNISEDEDDSLGRWVREQGIKRKEKGKGRGNKFVDASLLLTNAFIVVLDREDSEPSSRRVDSHPLHVMKVLIMLSSPTDSFINPGCIEEPNAS